MTRVFHARLRPDKVKVQSKSSPIQLRSWQLDWTLSSTRTLRKSACLTSMWEMRRLFRKLSKQSWKPRESTILMRLLLTSLKLKNRTFSYSTMFYFFSLSPKTDGGLINEQIVVKAKIRKKCRVFFVKKIIMILVLIGGNIIDFNDLRNNLGIGRFS